MPEGPRPGASDLVHTRKAVRPLTYAERTHHCHSVYVGFCCTCQVRLQTYDLCFTHAHNGLGSLAYTLFTRKTYSRP